jgi:salicylate hydroxylase
MSQTKDFTVAVVGGGIAGLTLAIALHQRNISVTVYERAAKFGEIGAGVSFTPNAIRAMKGCHPGIADAFEKVCTRNGWESKRNVWFEYVDGVESVSRFHITSSSGQNGVYRAHFLDELVKLLPADRAVFGKCLEEVVQSDGAKVTMKFADGTTAHADAVIGCDGIKSKVRQFVVGANHPSVVPSYTHKYAYRAMIPMEKAIEAIGEEKARNACMHVSYDDTADESAAGC